MIYGFYLLIYFNGQHEIYLVKEVDHCVPKTDPAGCGSLDKLLGVSGSQPVPLLSVWPSPPAFEAGPGDSEKWASPPLHLRSLKNGA